MRGSTSVPEEDPASQQPPSHRLEAPLERGEVCASASGRIAEVDKYRGGALTPLVAGEKAAVVVLLEPLAFPVPGQLPRLEVLDGHADSMAASARRARNPREIIADQVSSVVELVRLIECPETTTLGVEPNDRAFPPVDVLEIVDETVTLLRVQEIVNTRDRAARRVTRFVHQSTTSERLTWSSNLPRLRRDVPLA